MRRNRIIDNALVISGGLVMLTLMVGVLLAGGTVSADDSSVVQTSITVPIACTLRGTGTDSHTATLAPNTYSGASGSEYENGIGKTTLTAICNDDNGFSIYAIGYTGDSYDSADHTKLVGSSTGGTIATKAYASGDTASNWSMKLTKVTDSTVSYNPTNLTISTGYDAWHAIPDTYTKVAQYKANTGSSTTDTTLGVKLETTYAAFIAQNQPADTYVGQVKYTMVHPYDEEPLQPQASNSGKICYYKNASNAEGTMGCQNVASSVTLLASNFSRTGYGFAGWSDKFDYANNNEAHFYGPQEQLSIPDTSVYTGEGKGLSLYAVWVKSEGNLQDSSKVATVCNGLTQAPTNGTANLSSVSALTDSRDNQTYAIAKLADGNCWMIENMRLENTNSDNTTGALAQGYGGQFAGLANPETAWANNITTANSLYSTDGADDTINIGTSNASYRFPRYNNVNTPTTTADRPSNPTTNSATNSTSNASMFSYGNYYTWHAAIADTTAYTSNNTSVTNTSICPSGWRLPKGGQITVNTTAEFYVLGKSLMKDSGGNGIEPNQNASNGYGYYDNTPTNIDGDTATKVFRKYPNNFVYSGSVYSGSVNDRGSYGYYWSSTARSSIYAYYLNLDSSDVYPGTYILNKYYGWTIRCVASGA